jgi:hypothetical protein
MNKEQGNKPFVVITGGKDKTGKRGGKTATGLTVKQESFCQALARGLSASDAYRAAYNAEGMKGNVVNNEASKLATRRDITDRTEAIIAENKRKNMMATEKAALKHSERIWARIWSMIDDQTTPPAVKANLLSLGAKAAGMLTDKVELETKQADSKSIESELLERLQRLTG